MRLQKLASSPYSSRDPPRRNNSSNFGSHRNKKPRKEKATGNCTCNQLDSSPYSSRDPPRRTSPVTLVAIETRNHDPRSYRGQKKAKKPSRDLPRRTSPVTLVAIETRNRDPRSYGGQKEMRRKRVFIYSARYRDDHAVRSTPMEKGALHHLCV
ncbi:hypothetical protein CEXT_539951 [Caerostris extrusa]|uniref:Uncharacterized protein n=1 Tax=Caerostris extrusa TaxID=172846 RepID=A0AAV4QK08_CAEEX|nr:hypothetical protein CEXT_539951 [Caerostris extrusa]